MSSLYEEQYGVPIWPGSGSNPVGKTPYGYYDSDAEFVTDAQKTAVFCANMLGYPVVPVELQDIHFYACFENAITVYGSIVNQYNIKDNLYNVKGMDSSVNLTNVLVKGSLQPIIELANEYGAASSGPYSPNSVVKKVKIPVSGSIQDYDLNYHISDTHESGSRIRVRKVFHNRFPAVRRAITYGHSSALNEVMEAFGWRDYQPMEFLMLPVSYDLLRTQMIEFDEQVRRSYYNFELQGRTLKLHPVPKFDFDLWINYEVINSGSYVMSSGSVMTDFSNVNYKNLQYSKINAPGKDWIRRYTLADAKGVLGNIRGKFKSILSPGQEISLDGDTLRQESDNEKKALIEELNKMLEEMSKKSQLLMKKEESEAIGKIISKIPKLLYIR